MTQDNLPAHYKPVESSNIKAIAFFHRESDIPFDYDKLPNMIVLGEAAAEGRLEILFKSGGRYAYDRVPVIHANELLNEPNPGKYLNANIISHKDLYLHESLGQWPAEAMDEHAITINGEIFQDEQIKP